MIVHIENMLWSCAIHVYQRIPKQHYLLEQLLHSVPYLLDPNNEEQIETKTLWKDGVHSIGVYFSAH